MKPVRHALKIWILTIVLALGIVASLASAAFCAGVGQDQKERLKDFAMETRRKAQGERESLMRARMELLRLYSDYNLNERKANAVIDQIDQAQLRLLNIHFENQIGVRRILNPSQFAQFREMLGERMRDPEMGFMRPMRDDAIDEFVDKTMREDLNLSADQKRRVGGQMNQLVQKRVNIIQKLQRDARQMAGMYASYDLDEAAGRKLIGSIHENQSDLLNLNFRKQQIIRSVLTEPQFNALVARIRTKMNEDRPGQRRPWRGRGRE
ncbi:MAG: hypothetical protein ACYC64_03500 [Armatimonadota bacterium]